MKIHCLSKVKHIVEQKLELVNSSVQLLYSLHGLLVLKMSSAPNVAFYIAIAFYLRGSSRYHFNVSKSCFTTLMGNNIVYQQGKTSSLGL